MKQLYRLSHLLLPEARKVHEWNKPRTKYGLQSRRGYYGYEYEDYTYPGDAQTKRCFSQIARIALEHGWLDLYGRVPLQQKTTSDALEALGGFLCTVGASFIKVDMDRMIRDNVNLADKYRLLQKITEAFNERLGELSATTRYKDEFDAWYSSAFTDVLGTQQRANKEDGIVLGEIARTCQPEVGEQILEKLKSASTQTVAAFVISLTKEYTHLGPLPQLNFVRDTLDLLWDNFEYSEPLRTHGAPVEGLNQHELATIIDLTKKYGQLTMNEVFKTMSEALVKVSGKYIEEDLLPLIKAIMAHEIPSIIVEDNPDLFDCVATYIQHVLCKYIQQLVGEEPRQPKDWSLPDRGCKSCEPCKEVGTFMADKKQKFFKEKYVEHIRKHLENYFRNCGSQNEYTISVDKSAKPYFWVCTKTHGSYKSLLAKWRRNRQNAQKKLKSIAGAKSELLKTYLGENFDAIMSCQTEDLPDLSSAELGAKTPLGDTGPSTLNISNSKKRKSNSGDIDGTDNDRAAKRARPGNALTGSTEVIDLT